MKKYSVLGIYMSHHKSAEDIFHELRIIKSQVEQDAKIDEECGDDKQLRESVISAAG